ncbi:hypothetical protein ACWC9T_40910 [Kitasatospora sp. NPDC001159]
MTDQLGKVGGYTVQPDALHGVAEALNDVATDLTSADLAYTGLVTYEAAAFGECGMDQAWSNFDGNWGKELHLTQRAVAELAQKMFTTTGNHRAADAQVAASMIPQQT